MIHPVLQSQSVTGPTHFSPWSQRIPCMFKGLSWNSFMREVKNQIEERYCGKECCVIHKVLKSLVNLKSQMFWMSMQISKCPESYLEMPQLYHSPPSVKWDTSSLEHCLSSWFKIQAFAGDTRKSEQVCHVHIQSLLQWSNERHGGK